METDYKTQFKFEYTNTCTCTFYDEDKDEYLESSDCYGDCWEFVLEDFSDITKSLFDKNDTLWWKVSNLRLWDGNHSGYGKAKDSKDLLGLMTVNSEWNIKGEVFNDRIEYSLSHHDSMGSNTVVTMITDEQREELGLY
jgi:hypothetical protein